AAAAVMALYCLACDGGASVARAGIVGGLGLVAELGARPRDRWHLLLVGLAALLAAQPGSIGDPGLDLSFAAVAGLFTIAPPLAALLRGWLPGDSPTSRPRPRPPPWRPGRSWSSISAPCRLPASR